MRIVRHLSVQILAVAGLASSTAVLADDFRIQAQLAYDKINFDDIDEDADLLSATGTFYFKPVPTDGVPVGEAAYIARSSYVDLEAASAEFAGEDVDAFAANVGYHFTNTIFFARVGVVQSDVSGVDDTSWNGTLGIVPVPRLFFGTDFTEDNYDPNITARYAGQLANSHWYAGSISLTDPDDGDTDLGLEFDYYFEKFKLGGGFHSGSDVWTVRAEVGLPHGFALLGRYFTDDFSDGVGLTLTWRDL